MLSTMSMSHFDRLTTPPTAVTAPRHARSEEGVLVRNECQQRIIKRRKNVSNPKRKADRSQQTFEKFTPIKTTPRPQKWAAKFLANETSDDKANSDGELSTEKDELDKLTEQVHVFKERVSKLHDEKDDLKWSIFRNICLVMGMLIMYVVIGGYRILPASCKELIVNFLTEEFGTEYYYGSVIFNVFQDMGTVISGHF